MGFVLVGIRVWGRRCAAHVPILPGGILSLARVSFVQLRWPRSPGHLVMIRLLLRVRSEVKKDRLLDARDSVCTRDSVLWSGPMHARARIESAQSSIQRYYENLKKHAALLGTLCNESWLWKLRCSASFCTQRYGDCPHM